MASELIFSRALKGVKEKGRAIDQIFSAFMIMSMELFIDIISERFTWGLLVGLLLVVMVWRLMRKDVVMLRNEKERMFSENKELQTHLNTQLKINSKGNEQLQSQVDELREQNENLRVNLGTVGQKAGRVEMRQLHVMEAAVRVMREQAPGFASAWEKALRDAEATEQEAEGGLKKLIRKVLPAGRATHTLEEKKEARDEDGRDVS